MHKMVLKEKKSVEKNSTSLPFFLFPLFILTLFPLFILIDTVHQHSFFHLTTKAIKYPLSIGNFKDLDTTNDEKNHQKNEEKKNFAPQVLYFKPAKHTKSLNLT